MSPNDESECDARGDLRRDTCSIQFGDNKQKSDMILQECCFHLLQS